MQVLNSSKDGSILQYFDGLKEGLWQIRNPLPLQ